MATDISLQETTYQVGDRRWLLSPHGTDYTPGVTLDVASSPGHALPERYIPSGTVVGIVTATGKASVPAAGGLGWHRGRGRDSVRRLPGDPRQRHHRHQCGFEVLVHGFVDAAKLPFPIDAAGATG